MTGPTGDRANWQNPAEPLNSGGAPYRDPSAAPRSQQPYASQPSSYGGPREMSRETDSEAAYARRHRELELEAEERRLREEDRRSKAARTELMTTRVVNGIYFLIGALEVLLLLRLVLRMSGANAQNTFASFIYGLSEPFVAPFSTLFISPTADGARYIFDLNLIVAMIVYGLLGLLAGRLVRVFMGSSTR